MHRKRLETTVVGKWLVQQDPVHSPNKSLPNFLMADHDASVQGGRTKESFSSNKQKINQIILIILKTTSSYAYHIYSTCSVYSSLASVGVSIKWNRLFLAAFSLLFSTKLPLKLRIFWMRRDW